MKLMRPMLLTAALLFIAAATLTSGSGDLSNALHPKLWCLGCGPYGSADVAVNVALFVPLGAAIALYDISTFRAVLLALLLSACIELAQRYGVVTSRVSNAADVAMNTLGALLGALVVHTRKAWLFPDRVTGRILALGYSLFLIALFTLSAWSLSAAPNEVGETQLLPSQYPFTAGYGWYHGFLSDVVVNGRQFTHRGDGPFTLRGVGDSVRTIDVRVRGRDERSSFVPFLFLHGTDLSRPDVLLGQEGDDLRMSVAVRGARLRLPGPHVILSDAFANTDSTNHHFGATVSSRQWSLNSESGGKTKTVSLPVSLGLSWTLFQTVVRPTRVTTLLVTVLWMCALCIPLGYACSATAQSVRSSANALVFGLACVVLALGLLPRWAGIAGTSAIEWSSAFAGYATGVFFATRVWRHQQRSQRSVVEHGRLTQVQ